MALGGAFVSLADDASAVHANPAGLIQIEKAVFSWQLLSQIPMQRLGTVEECIGAYLFLASTAMSGYITGQIIDVNGGQLMP